MRLRPLPVLSLALAATALGPVTGATAVAAEGELPTLPAAADRTVTVASFNIHHGAGTDGVLDLERIAGVLEGSGAEVIGLQEVDNHWSERSEFEDQAAWLAERLDMEVCYSANLDNPPAAGQEERRQYGTAILSAYPLSDCANTPLPNHPGGEQRGLGQADVRVRGVEFRIYNTHLTHNSAAGREEQARAINALVADDDLPTVLVGDLNAEPDSQAYPLFTTHLQDVWTAVGEGPGHTIDPVDPDRRIDYVLVSEDITPVSAEVLDTQSSDHLPVIAEIELPHPAEVNGDL